MQEDPLGSLKPPRIAEFKDRWETLKAKRPFLCARDSFLDQAFTACEAAGLPEVCYLLFVTAAERQHFKEWRRQTADKIQEIHRQLKERTGSRLPDLLTLSPEARIDLEALLDE